MTGTHEIVVARDGGGWRVSVVPPLPLGDACEVLSDYGVAMARARLLRLRHGFPIVAPTSVAGRASR